MKLYLASRFSRAAELNAYAATIRDGPRGHSIVSEWHRPLGERHMSVAERDAIEAGTAPDALIARVARETLGHLADADAIVLFLDDVPNGRPAHGGRDVEFGYAHGLGGITKIVVGPRSNVFTWLADYHVETTTDFLRWIEGSS